MVGHLHHLHPDSTIRNVLVYRLISVGTVSQAGATSFSIPACNCHVEHDRYGEYTSNVIKCGVHDVAPQILSKYNSILGERNDLLQRLKNLPSILSKNICRKPTIGIPSGSIASGSEGEGEQYVSIDKELSPASWIRHAGKDT